MHFLRAKWPPGESEPRTLTRARGAHTAVPWGRVGGPSSNKSVCTTCREAGLLKRRVCRVTNIPKKTPHDFILQIVKACRPFKSSLSETQSQIISEASHMSSVFTPVL